MEWEAMQAQYYHDIKSRRSSKRWTVALITKLWEVAWELWDFRNAVFHHQQNQSLLEDRSVLDDKVRDYLTYLSLTGLLPKDKHLATISLPRLLLFPRHQKVEWIQQAALTMAQAKKSNFRLRLAQKEHLQRRQNMIVSMQITFQNWLLSAS
jgi:hypothetical protein